MNVYALPSGMQVQEIRSDKGSIFEARAGELIAYGETAKDAVRGLLLRNPGKWAVIKNVAESKVA